MTRRWRLFPKYALLIITLVGSMLVASGAIGIYFSWRESEAHLRALQVEKAQDAAYRIEQYIVDIEHELSWTALPRAESDGDALESRRIEYLKLQRQAPAITEVVWIDPKGREQLRISRLAMDVIGSGTDMSQEEKFRRGSNGVYYGPVYFRKGTEPYMTIARPAGSGGGVTAAEVNLKFVWDVVSRIKIGTAGLAYVVDANGVLIAHPDISLVLKNSDLSTLPQVAALLRPADGRPPVARDLKGEEVFAANASIPTLHWTVFVESPRAEAFAPLYSTLQGTSVFLVAALLISIAASFFLARALVRPLRALQEGAAQIGAGDLERHIEVRTGDELEGLAEQFNRMTAQLRESYAGLERKVEQRTSELTEALEQQTATAEVLRVISSSVADAQPVFEKITQSCGRLFAGTRAAINLVGADGLIHLAACEGPGSEAFAAMFPFAPSNESGTTLAMTERRVMHYPNVDDPDVPDGVRRGMATGGWKSVLFAPLLLDDRGIGAIAVSREEPRSFLPSEIALLKTFADQAVIAIENARLFNETQEALEQQTATAEVLRVISGSVADSRPVFEKILESCQRLFASNEQGVLLVGEDNRLHLGAHHGSARERLEHLFPIDRVAGDDAARRERSVVHIRDVLGDADVPAGMRALAEQIGVGTYSQVIAPMLWEGEFIGALYVIRQPAVGFGEKEIGLLRTFADQAVIAIQNARLFNETREALRKVEQRTAELSEALDYQTAISDVLRVISQSPTNVAPVFEAILESAWRLFGSPMSAVLRYDGRLVYLAATRDWSAEAIADASRFYPAPPNPRMLSGRVILSGSVQSEEDALTDPQYDRQAAGLGHWRRMIGAPLLRDGQPIGAIIVAWPEPGPTPTRQADLLKTFADQAVIAIENVRLLSETTEALEQQTATAGVLQVISGALADTQPVFDKILDSCERLFDSTGLGIYLMSDDGTLRTAAVRTKSAKAVEVLKLAVQRPGQGATRSPVGAVIRERRMLNYDHAPGAPDAPEALRHVADRIADYSIVIAPMAAGALLVFRDPAQPFTARELELIRTFGDQAVIAIENARLFTETKEALEQQTATAEVLQVISSSVADTQPVFDKILDSCERLFAATSLGIYLTDDAGMLHRAGFRSKIEKAERALGGTFPLPLEGTATAAAIRERRVVHYPDVLAAVNAPAPLVRIAQATGSFSIAFAPMLWEGRGVGAIQVSREPPSAFSDKELALLKTFADQAVIAIQNARLFNEIQAKSRELELANKHKSEFLANMSHELRTPLNAIIGFSEVLSEKMFGEVNDKQLEYLLDIHTSGHHLLSLINDILDLSKIEAGRMELDLATTNLPMLLDNCTTLVRERANRQGLVLALEVEDGLGDWVADIRKLKQIVINLLSNAVKFTPAGGKVTLRARRLAHAVEIAVVDTGVGIAPDQQALVFEEFRQAGGDYLRKSEGTGLGLSLAKRFVELHGGTMRVESEPGRGSTFAFVLPERIVEAV